METDLQDQNKVDQMIDKQREKRGVLVFGDDDIVKRLEVIDDYVLVTDKTTDEELR